MAITSYPFDNQLVSEAQYSALFSEVQDSGVAGSFGASDLRVSISPTAMRLNVSPGSAFIQGHFFSSTATEQVAIAVGSAAARIDTVILRLDQASNAITLQVLTGTAQVNPVFPVLTRTQTVYEIPLAHIRVPANAASLLSANLIEARPFIGHRTGAWSNATRPATARLGRLGYNTDSRVWEFYNGTTWADLTPSSLPASVVTSGVLPPERGGTGNALVRSTLAADAGGTGNNWSLVAVDRTTGQMARANGAINAAYIPALPASRITSGTFTAAQIPNLDASKLTAGVLHGDRIPNINASKITAGTLNKARLPALYSADITHAGVRFDAWWNAVNDSFDRVRADINYVANVQIPGRAVAWGGDGNAVRYAHGPHHTAYNRQAGNNRFAVWMDGDLIFGRATSSLRYKDTVRPWEIDVDKVLAIEPKTFHRKVDPQGEMDYGAIAEEIHDLGLHELVYYDDEGRPDAIREHHLPWALVAVVKSQQAQIDALTKRLDDLEVVVAT